MKKEYIINMDFPREHDCFIEALNKQIDKILSETYEYSLECNSEKCFVYIIQLVREAFILHKIRCQIGVSWASSINQPSVEDLQFNYDNEIFKLLKDKNNKLTKIFNRK